MFNHVLFKSEPSVSIYLPCGDTCASRCNISKLKTKKGDVTNIQRLKIKQARIQVRFKSKSMVILYMVRRDQYCRLLGWTAPMWSRPVFRGGGGCSSDIQLLERMKKCSNQSQQLVISRSSHQPVGIIIGITWTRFLLNISPFCINETGEAYVITK